MYHIIIFGMNIMYLLIFYLKYVKRNAIYYNSILYKCKVMDSTLPYFYKFVFLVEMIQVYFFKFYFLEKKTMK